MVVTVAVVVQECGSHSDGASSERAFANACTRVDSSSRNTAAGAMEGSHSAGCVWLPAQMRASASQSPQTRLFDRPHAPRPRGPLL